MGKVWAGPPYSDGRVVTLGRLYRVLIQTRQRSGPVPTTNIDHVKEVHMDAA